MLSPNELSVKFQEKLLSAVKAINKKLGVTLDTTMGECIRLCREHKEDVFILMTNELLADGEFVANLKELCGESFDVKELITAMREAYDAQFDQMYNLYA